MCPHTPWETTRPQTKHNSQTKGNMTHKLMRRSEVGALSDTPDPTSSRVTERRHDKIISIASCAIRRAR